MLQPLRSNGRRALLRASALSLAGALLTLPLALPVKLPASAGVPPPPAPAAPGIADVPDDPPPNIARDPFVPDAAEPEAGGNAPASAGIAVVAVALGDAPRALVRTGETSRIVGAGDALGDSTVREIGAHGIVLESGEVLPLAAPR
jgi:hypothetical protein